MQFNSAQLTAITAPFHKHILVLAGAGTGKTKVLTHRIAYLLDTGQVQLYNILAVTFTNKAAREMRERIKALSHFGPLWANTFHSTAYLILRQHWQAAQLPITFQIIDSGEQLDVLKRVLSVLGLDEEVWCPKQTQQFINKCKDWGLRVQQIEQINDAWHTQMCQIYATYDEWCQRSGLVDFGELLLRCYELWCKYPELLTQYQQRFQYILVDEFQDTSCIQYDWLKLLAGKSNKLFVVGDDDQSIYSWRNASAKNLFEFKREFNPRLVRLEQNYRSSATVLAAANALISCNTERLGKNLWTESTVSNLIQLYTAHDEIDEAHFVANTIQSLKTNRQQIAILYRTTAQSRLFEEQLLRRNIPYYIYNSLRFYERQEIKDILAYLRLLQNRDDDAAFNRIVNRPKLGIGERTLKTLYQHSQEHKISLWKASQSVLANRYLKNRANNAVVEFLDQIERLDEQVAHLPLYQKIQQLKTLTGLNSYYQKEGKLLAQQRLENIDELVNAAQQFEQNIFISYTDRTEPDLKNLEPEQNILMDFLAHIALGSNQQDQKNCVQLMTLHAAKGLEFEVVFICGLEEKLFPHINSLEENRLEEERRLCYVGITRARQQLYLSHAENRRVFGKQKFFARSRFINEIPEQLICEVGETAANFDIEELLLGLET